MVIPSPLHQRFEQHVAEQAARVQASVAMAARPGSTQTAPLVPAVAWIPYGPDNPEVCVQMAAEFGSPAAEYAAIRRGVGVMDGMHRGTLVVTGADRLTFLQRMVTQDLQGLLVGGVRESFWLNRKGRVQADMLLAQGDQHMLIDVDRFAAAAAASELQAFVFGEDVQIENATDAYGRIALHGAAALALLASVADGAALASDLCCASLCIAQCEVQAVRRDQTGAPGVELFMASANVVAVYDALIAAGAALASPVRPMGWHAFNVARIEAGTPLFLVDFGREVLPHETGVLARRVNFKKGCYLGQEVVARMQSLGKPKQRLVGLRMQSDRLPVCGAVVHIQTPGGDTIGSITSSAPAPMLGSACVAFAMLKYAHSESGACVRVAAEGEWSDAVVQPSLRFLPVGGAE